MLFALNAARKKSVELTFQDGEAFEFCRFKVAIAVLKWSYTGEKQAANCFDVSALEEPPGQLSTLQAFVFQLNK